MKILLPIITVCFLFLYSCGKTPDQLIRNGQLKEALKIYKGRLEDDYHNKELRNKIVNLYYQKSRNYIQTKELEKALRELERAVIYKDPQDSILTSEYASIVCEIGYNYLGDMNNIEFENMTPMRQRNIKKGLALIKKSKSMKNGKAIAILNDYDKYKAQFYFSKAKRMFTIWKDLKKDKNQLLASYKEFCYAKELGYSSKILAKYFEELKEFMLFFDFDEEKYEISIEGPKIFFNNQTGLLAFNVRLHNNEKKGYRAVSPKQFTLFDRNGKAFEAITDKSKLEGYLGLFRKGVLPAGRSIKGLLVFKVGRYRQTFDKLLWISNLEDKAVKLFPNKKITKIEVL